MERNFISYSRKGMIQFTCLQMYFFICPSEGKLCLSEGFVILYLYKIKIGKINTFYCISIFFLLRPAIADLLQCAQKITFFTVYYA